ncbi:MAG: outer membrane beta-barrel protein [Cyclobacteriaceae bacterium]
MRNASICIVTLLLMMLTSSGASAQSCDKKLSDAEKAFEIGNLYSLSVILIPCIENGSYNRDEKIRALRLLSISSLYLDEPESAERYFLSLLKLKPDYKPQPSDPSELTDLSRKYTTLPFITLLPLQFGVTNAMPSVINEYVIDSESDGQSYESRSAISAGVSAEVMIKPWLNVGTGAYYNTYQFKYLNTILGYSTLSFTEHRQTISLPLYLRVTHPDFFRKVKPYFFVGGSYDLTLGAEAQNLLREDMNLREVDVTGPNIDLNDQRNTTGYSAIAGIGASIRAGTNFILIDVGYKMGLTNNLDSEGQYSNNTLVFQYGFTDNDHTLNSLNAMIRFMVPLYAPRKLKKPGEL